MPEPETYVAGLLLLGVLFAPALAWAQVAEQPSRETTRQEVRTGLGLNNRGGNDDPTENVKALNAAEAKRQDDLRIAAEKLTQARLDAVKEIGDLHFLRNKELREATFLRVDSESKLRAEYEGLLRQAEAKRIDAIRLVDVSAAATLAQRTTEQATALAKTLQDTAQAQSTQTARQAEDLRKLVETTALETNRNVQQQFANVQTQFTGLGTRLTELERAGAEGKGSARFQDPAVAAQLSRLEATVTALATSRASTSGIGEGRGEVIGWIVAGLLLLVGIGGLLFNIMKNGKRTP